MDDTTRADYDRLAERLTAWGADVAAIERRLAEHRIETPSWGYANAGTRFGSYPPAGLPTNPFEKLDDAAEVHRLTGIAPLVAIHIPWDKLDDYGPLKEHAASLGLEIGTVNPNLFGDQRYKLGSLVNADVDVRRLAIDHCLECIEIAKQVGSTGISLWLPDGTNYPGQDSFVERRRRLHESLSEVYGALAPGMELLVEYKLYEPAFYATDLADWGSSLMACQKLGPAARVLVDLGHHAQGVNIEQIVAVLQDEERLGGFHFNNRKYGDDDLIVGSVNPFELFLIYVELAAAPQLPRLTIDQAHVIENKIEGMVLSVVNLQEAFAKALLVDRAALAERQAAGDVLGAHEALLDAFRTDVRPLAAKVREEKGAEADPVAAFRAGDWWERVGSRRNAAATTGGLGA
ncbi:MAG TPA: L-rhamnose isomerase [Conexibacter sp.]|jgi:L-rhamnose isomerase/sugar isomerase